MLNGSTGLLLGRDYSGTQGQEMLGKFKSVIVLPMSASDHIFWSMALSGRQSSYVGSRDGDDFCSLVSGMD